VRLWNQRWTGEKVSKRALKFAVWFLIALGTGGAWVFYFADAPMLARDLVTLQAPFVAYAAMGILTATTFVFGGFAREQICLYACPWPRIQAAMTDENTLTVSYRDWRGEPRGKHRKSEAAASLGDCIDCSACVNVCPTGVDIRNGQQMGCITCALCIDACDDVMKRIGKPRGLIDYVTLADGERERQGEPVVPIWRRIARPRIALYFTLWAGIGLAMLAALAVRTDMTIAIEPVRNPINVVLSDGSVRNAYEIRLRNMTGDAREFQFSAAADAPLLLDLQAVDGLVVTVPADQTLRQRLYLTADPTSPAATIDRLPVALAVEDMATGARTSETTVFHGRPR
jgi:cytochrome c oxidase accessory protein FixG